MPVADAPPPLDHEIPETESAGSDIRGMGAAFPAPSQPGSGLAPGERIADRFLVERQAGVGGMGVVHRAMDAVTGRPVAVKVIARPEPEHAERFEREVAVLATLSHAAIVGYVAHGQTAQGMPFLAMEWLEGEDLSARLARGPLTVREGLVLLRRACEGLAAAHERGIVHRDIKPSNLFLVGGRPEALKVLDFGIARQREGTRAFTQSGVILGTVGYMAPEQALASRELDPRADVFALGCVLFECLTGRAAFTGPNAIAVLAKVLHDEPPRVAELRPDLDGELDALVARMLSKDPADRPRDATAVRRALDDVEDEATGATLLSRSAPGLTRGEQRVVSVILGRSGQVPARAGDGAFGPFRDLTRRFGAEPLELRDGSLLVCLSGRGAATDQARQAATCALGLHRLRQDFRLCVATGRAETTGGVPMGAVIDRAATLLARASDPARGVAVDELTAGLLDPGFDLRGEGESRFLVGWREDLEATRLLMGKPTPFVGRDRELGLLDLTFRECVDDGVARAVLVTGPPGQGKSRLRQEFAARVREGGGARVLIARADPVGAGSALLLARQLARAALGIRESETASDGPRRVRDYVSERLDLPEGGRVAEFLGEMIGVAVLPVPSPELRSARNDPEIMGVWLRESFVAWLDAESARGPLVLVLEDLHWGDLSSVSYLHEALRALATRPLMVLALARPEVHAVFPGLWASASLHEVPLGGLTRRACERLVRAALGDGAGEEAVTRLIERADGSAFYLEELIRHAADGGDRDTLPETVLALVESRLDRLAPEARRIARAASVFGEVFWHDAVATVLGADGEVARVDRGLAALVEREVLALAPASRFPGQRQYAFRHGLIRAAAYAMLTEADRATAHALAGQWLEGAGERDALTLAEHFEHGAAPDRAAPWLLSAAEAAWDGGNLASALALADRGMACHPGDALRGRFLRVQGSARAQRAEWRAAQELARASMVLLPPGSAPWFDSAGLAFNAGMFLGDFSITASALQAILEVSSEPELSGAYAWTMHQTCFGLSSMGQFDLAWSMLQRAEARGIEAGDADPIFVLRLRLARMFLHMVSGETGHSLATVAAARRQLESTGDLLGRTAAGNLFILALAEAGAWERAMAVYREVQSLTQWRFWIDHCELGVGYAMINSDRVREGIDRLRALLDREDPVFTTRVRTIVAYGLTRAGDLDAAMDEATKVIGAPIAIPDTLATAHAAVARVAVLRGRPAEALVSLERGREAYASGWRYSSMVSLLDVTRAEALHALGQTEAAHAAIREARDRVLAVAATIAERDLRDSYRTRVGPNARAMELAGLWLGEPDPA